MSMYPQVMWQILNAAKSGQSFSIEFQAHNEACAMISRWSRFRMDAIETRTEGALYLREVMATGVDGRGERFHTARHDSLGPFKITWKYIGSPETRLGIEHQEKQDAMSGQIRQEDVEPERQVRELVKSINRELKPDSDPVEDLARQWAREGAKPNTTPIAECQHVWDITETRCLKCGAPKP